MVSSDDVGERREHIGRHWRCNHSGTDQISEVIIPGIVLALLAAGADVHAKDEDGWPPLHWACFMGCKEVDKHLSIEGVT